MKEWFKNHTPDELQAMRCLTQRMDKQAFQGRDGGDNQKQSNLNLIKEITETVHQENDIDKPYFFFMNGYVSRVKNDDRLYY